MDWTGAAQWWVPTLAVVVLAVVSLIVVERRRSRIMALMAVAALAIVATVWQQTASHSAFTNIAAELRDLSGRLGTIGELLPNDSGSTPQEVSDSVAAGIVALSQKVKNLEDQISALQQKYKNRTVDDATAGKLADYLRSLGTARVVVSCVPNDVEAYGYANRIVEILRSAGWDALGPETTTVNGDTPAMDIAFYVRGDPGQQVARALIEAFRRFNIPYRPQIAGGETIPDTATVELFVAAKP